MTNDEIIKTLKSQYNKDIRNQLVESLLEVEKAEETETQYKLMNQIFSYVLAQLGWNMAENTENWDTGPLEIMTEVFPEIQTTLWYKEQILSTDKSINVVSGAAE
jgi:hypothetical protein